MLAAEFIGRVNIRPARARSPPPTGCAVAFQPIPQRGHQHFIVCQHDRRHDQGPDTRVVLPRKHQEHGLADLHRRGGMVHFRGQRFLVGGAIAIQGDEDGQAGHAMHGIELAVAGAVQVELGYILLIERLGRQRLLRGQFLRRLRHADLVLRGTAGQHGKADDTGDQNTYVKTSALHGSLLRT